MNQETAMDSVSGLVGKWREEAGEKPTKESAATFSGGLSVARHLCAAELEIALAQPAGERCKTVIVYGDHGPEEREPVEDYYDAPQQPAGEAVGWVRNHAIKAMESSADITAVVLHRDEQADSIPVYTTPADSAPLVEALREVVAEMRAGKWLSRDERDSTDYEHLIDEWATQLEPFIREVK